MTTINDFVTLRTTPDMRISWTPQGPTIAYSVNGNTYITTGKQTPINALLSFTGSAIFPPGDPDLSIVGWEWDFGDGVKGSGQFVNHVYVAANPAARVHLTVQDSLGRYFSIGKQLNLTLGLKVAVLVPSIVCKLA